MKSAYLRTALCSILFSSAFAWANAFAADHWSTVWTAASQGPYPAGVPSGQPDLSSTFPNAKIGARNQSFRMIIKPDVFGPQFRIRLSNAFGTRPVTFDNVTLGVHASAAAIVPGSMRSILFRGQQHITVAPGTEVWSDPIDSPFGTSRDPLTLDGRAFAVSFHVVGESGPMTWHAKAMTTSYVSAPDAGAVSAKLDDTDFPASTTSWFFLDALDAITPEDTRVVVALGDSITDGTASTIGGSDRWVDVLSRRLHARYHDHIAVVDEGIGGNQILNPTLYSVADPPLGGPSALSRIQRDVISLSGVSDVIWFEGINDLEAGRASPDAVMEGLTTGVAHIRAGLPGVKVMGATLTTSLGSKLPHYGSVEVDARRNVVNGRLAKCGIFDDVIDFDSVVTDPSTGKLRDAFVPSSTAGAISDDLHPNRRGYQAMGSMIDLSLFSR